MMAENEADSEEEKPEDSSADENDSAESEDSKSEGDESEKEESEDGEKTEADNPDSSGEESDSDDAAGQYQAPAKGEVITYDFTHPLHRLSERVPQLEMGGESLALSVNRMIDNTLHIPCKVSLESATLSKYQEYVNTIKPRDCVFDSALQPIGSPVLFCFEQSMITKMVERYFGGSGPASDSVERGYSATEKRLADRLYRCVAKSINEVWGALFSASESAGGIIGRRDVDVAQTEASIVGVLRCQVLLDETTVNFSVVLPWQALLLIRRTPALGQAAQDQPDEGWTNALVEKLSVCEVDVHGLLAETRVTVEHLLKMQAGDFIPLGEQQTATFMIDNTPVFNALIGSSKAQVSASFLSWISQGESSK